MLTGCQQLKGIFGNEVLVLLALEISWCLYSQKTTKPDSGGLFEAQPLKKDTWREKVDLSLNGNRATDLLGLKETAVSPAMAAAANVQFTVTNAAFTI